MPRPTPCLSTSSNGSPRPNTQLSPRPNFPHRTLPQNSPRYSPTHLKDILLCDSLSSRPVFEYLRYHCELCLAARPRLKLLRPRPDRFHVRFRMREHYIVSKFIPKLL